MWSAFAYIGTHVANNLFTVILFCFFFTLVVTILTWATLRNYLFSSVWALRASLLLAITGIVVNAVIKTGTKKRVYGAYPKGKARFSKIVKNRHLWNAFDLLQARPRDAAAAHRGSLHV